MPDFLLRNKPHPSGIINNFKINIIISRYRIAQIFTVSSRNKSFQGHDKDFFRSS